MTLSVCPWSVVGRSELAFGLVVFPGYPWASRLAISPCISSFDLALLNYPKLDRSVVAPHGQGFAVVAEGQAMNACVFLRNIGGSAVGQIQKFDRSAVTQGHGLAIRAECQGQASVSTFHGAGDLAGVNIPRVERTRSAIGCRG